MLVNERMEGNEEELPDGEVGKINVQTAWELNAVLFKRILGGI